MWRSARRGAHREEAYLPGKPAALKRLGRARRRTRTLVTRMGAACGADDWLGGARMERRSQLHCRSGGSSSCWRSLRSSCMRSAAHACTTILCPIEVRRTTRPRSAGGVSPRHTAAAPSSEMPGGGGGGHSQHERPCLAEIGADVGVSTLFVTLSRAVRALSKCDDIGGRQAARASSWCSSATSASCWRARTAPGHGHRPARSLRLPARPLLVGWP